MASWRCDHSCLSSASLYHFGTFGSSGGENCAADGFAISSSVGRLSWLLATYSLRGGGILFTGFSCTLLRLSSDPSVVFVRCWNMFTCSPWFSFLNSRVDLLSYCFLCMSCRFCNCFLWLSKACVRCSRPLHGIVVWFGMSPVPVTDPGPRPLLFVAGSSLSGLTALWAHYFVDTMASLSHGECPTVCKRLQISDCCIGAVVWY